MRKIWLLLLLVCSPGVSFAAAKVELVRLMEANETTRVVFHLSQPTSYKLFTLGSPERIVVDLADTRLATSLKGIDYRGTSVTAIRSGPRPEGGLRVVMDLDTKAKPKNFILQPSDGQGLRLVVDVMPANAVVAMSTSPASAAAPAVVARNAEQQPAMPALPSTVPVRAPPAQVVAPAAPPATAMRAAPPVMDNEESLRDLIVAIDAGHGGVDPGALGLAGTREKDVVLAIARHLEKLVRAEPGMRPVMVRDGDYFVPLRDRVSRARDSKADILVSIHADAVNDRSARGSSVYVLSSRGASSEAARWLAEKENASDLIGGVSLDHKDGVLKSVLLDLSQTASIEASLTAGEQVLAHLKDVGRVHRHRVEQAGFAVLKAPDIPSMLVETAFISNPAEEKKLLSNAYQRQVAQAVLDGVQTYFRQNAPPGTKVAMWNSTRQHIIARGDTLAGIAGRYGVSVNQLKVTNKISDERLFIGEVLRIPPGT